jgi:hypothetical protein
MPSLLPPNRCPEEEELQRRLSAVLDGAGRTVTFQQLMEAPSFVGTAGKEWHGAWWWPHDLPQRFEIVIGMTHAGDREKKPACKQAENTSVQA